MRTRLFLAAIPLLIVSGPMTRAAHGKDAPADLVRVLTDVSESWERRYAVEDSLMLQPSIPVLEALFPHVARGFPTATVWNSRGRLYDREGIAVWQVYYAVKRTWEHHLSLLGMPRAGEVLVGFLRHAAAGPARIRLVQGLTRYWQPEAEPMLVGFLVDDLEFELQRATAICLIEHTGWGHADALMRAAERAVPVERSVWFELLSERATPARGAGDPRLLAMGFRLLEAEVGRVGPDGDQAYALVGRLETLSGQAFGRGAGDTFGVAPSDEDRQFAVWGALDWWVLNRARIELEADAARAGAHLGDG